MKRVYSKKGMFTAAVEVQHEAHFSTLSTSQQNTDKSLCSGVERVDLSHQGTPHRGYSIREAILDVCIAIYSDF